MKQIDLKKEIQEKAKQTALTFREAAKGMKAWKDAENDRETVMKDYLNFDSIKFYTKNLLKKCSYLLAFQRSKILNITLWLSQH